MFEQNLHFQQMCLSIINEKKINTEKQEGEEKNSFDLDDQTKEEFQTLCNENKMLREKNEEMQKNELKLSKKLTILNFEKSILIREQSVALAELSKIREDYQKLEKELTDSKNLIFQYENEKAQIKQKFEQELVVSLHLFSNGIP